MIGLLFMAGGTAALVALYLHHSEKEVPVNEPDLPPTAPAPPGFPKSTGYKLVDGILGELAKAATSANYPLGLLVGWIARESGGKLADTTSLDERGYFQLMPAESSSLGLDHQRLSTDSTYSINAGLLLIGKYMKSVDALGVAAPRSAYYWRLVKLVHSMGGGATKKIVNLAKAAGQASSWEALRNFAVAQKVSGPQPAKWFPFVDSVYKVGAPFGFGTDGATTVVGYGPAFTDIPDPLDYL